MCDFSHAHLNHTNLKGADLSTCTGLTQAQINHAIGDADTLLPDDLHHPASWA